MNDFKTVKKDLDNVGCGFCLAKWTQVTTHLGAGITHSCHHVGAHKIPLNELENNPNALHNTSQKKQMRKEMLSGQRPEECDYCWRIEDNTSEYSDRVLKSSRPWSQIDKDKILQNSWDEDIYPRYVEISFSNVCNFKCTYCGPPFSSKWTEEIKSKGPYKLKGVHYNTIKHNEVLIPEREENPYIKAFWKWFPEAVKHMHTFRITGGEPLLSKHTKKVIKHLIKNPQPNLNFSINTNACPPNNIWKEFISLIKELEKTKSVKSFTLFTSAESYGEQAEYARDGMNWNLFEKNIEYFLSNLTSKVVVMSAFNILSLPTLAGYLRYINILKRKYKSDRVLIDFAYVRHPKFLDINIATPYLIDKYLKPCIIYVKEMQRFSDYEFLKINRIYKDCLSNFENKKNVTLDRYRFVQFVNEYDKRREKNFLQVFPEFKDFYKTCGAHANV